MKQVSKKTDRLNDDKKIIVLGNYSPSKHDASRIVSIEGIAPTVKENHGTITAILLVESGEVTKCGSYYRANGGQ